MRQQQSLSFGFRSELQLPGPVALKVERAARPVFPCGKPDANPA